LNYLTAVMAVTSDDDLMKPRKVSNTEIMGAMV
jgi:hypothetical protein